MTADKTDWIPPEERKSDHAIAGPADLEYLDMLVYRGEGLLMDGLCFPQATQLLIYGLARVADTYGPIKRIVPTEAGITLAGIRENMKLQRVKKI